MSCNELLKINIQRKILNDVGIQSSLYTMRKQIMNTQIDKNFKNDSYQRYLNKKKLLLCKNLVISIPNKGNKTNSFSLNCNCKCSK